MQVDVVVTGDRQAAGVIDRLSRRLDDGTPAMRGLVDQLLEVEQERFAGRGVRWRRLSPQTRRIKAEQGLDPRPNIATGRMMRSLTTRHGPGQVVRVTPTSLTFGTSVWYARFAKKLGRNPVGATRTQRKQLVAELKRILVEDDR
jgi:hypothetical protein